MTGKQERVAVKWRYFDGAMCDDYSN